MFLSLLTAIRLRQQHHAEEDISGGTGSNHTSHRAEGPGIHVQTSKGWVTPESLLLSPVESKHFWGDRGDQDVLANRRIGWQTFSANGPIVNIGGFMGHAISDATTQSCCCSPKAAIDCTQTSGQIRVSA